MHFIIKAFHFVVCTKRWHS